MPLDCLQIDILTSVALFFKKTCFILYTTENIISKNGELGISGNIVMSERLLYLFYIFLRVFRSQVLQNYFRVFLLALSFKIMQDIYRRPVNSSLVEIQSWYLI